MPSSKVMSESSVSIPDEPFRIEKTRDGSEPLYAIMDCNSIVWESASSRRELLPMQNNLICAYKRGWHAARRGAPLPKPAPPKEAKNGKREKATGYGRTIRPGEIENIDDLYED